MLEIDITDVVVAGGFKIGKGVGWKFCELSWRFDKYGQEAYFEDGVFVVTNEWITFRASDDRNTIYEVKLSAVEEGKIRFRASDKKPLFHDGPLGDFEKEDREIDIAAFLKNNDQPGKIMICEKEVAWPDEEPYTQTLRMEVDRSSDILRFYLTVTYRPDYKENSSGGNFNWKTDSRINTMTLDKKVTFDFCNEPFMNVMKKVIDYCERKNVKLSFSCRDYMLPGHCIDIPQTVVSSERFEIVFDFEYVREVCVAKNIMNSTYYTDSLGDEYNIGDIVQEIPQKAKYRTFVEGYGAANMLKWVLPKEDKYIFYCGFGL